MLLTAAAVAIKGVVPVVAEEGEEGMCIAQEGTPGARTAEWTTTPPPSPASPIARHETVPPLRSTTPDVRATTVVCPAILGPAASTGSVLRSSETKLGTAAIAIANGDHDML